MLNLRTTLTTLTVLLLLPSTLGLVYWPITTPTDKSPWVLGQTNSIVWGSASDTGLTVFDIQLHNFNKSVMIGFYPIAQRVPMREFTSGKNKGNMGGELSVDLHDGFPTGDGFSLLFMETENGIVYAKSHKFSIYPAAKIPSNYTTATLPDGPPKTTAVITASPYPDQQWAITLDGVAKGAVSAAATATSLAGHVGP